MTAAMDALTIYRPDELMAGMIPGHLFLGIHALLADSGWKARPGDYFSSSTMVVARPM
jgi:hypothetical protein